MCSHATITKPRRFPLLELFQNHHINNYSDEGASLAVEDTTVSVAIQAFTYDSLETIEKLKDNVAQLKGDVTASKFCIEYIFKNEQMVTFNTDFPPSYASLKSYNDYLRSTYSE